MLFAVKNRLGATLVLLTVFVAASLVAREALVLRWRLELHPGLVGQAALGFGAVLACDGLLHGALTVLLGDRYRARYRALVAFFSPQGPAEIAAGGLLAGGGEELLFRGVVLQGLISRAGLAPGAAIGISALLFGAMHGMRDPKLRLFAAWGVLQGLLLGVLYVATGSLLVTMLVHGVHDITGFSLFAWERWSGKSPGSFG